MAKKTGTNYTVEEFLKDFGDDIFDPEDPRLQPNILPTDLDSLDLILGGGIRRGRTTMIYGVESSGKTLLTQVIIAASQRRGGVCFFVDAERTFDPNWFKLTGVDTDPAKLLIGRPMSTEHTFDMVEGALKAKYDVVVLDSVAAMVSQAAMDAKMVDKDFQGWDARKITQGVKKCNLVNESSAFIIINQMRSALGVTYGNPETIPGGRALRHAASVSLRLRRGAWVLDKEVDGDVPTFTSVDDSPETKRVGFRMRIRAEKNKTTIPWQETDIRVLFNGNVDALGSLVDLAIKRGVVVLEKGMSFYRVPGHDGLINGRKAVEDHLREDDDAREVVAAAVRNGG
jgi:recombination protein RecA